MERGGWGLGQGWGGCCGRGWARAQPLLCVRGRASRARAPPITRAPPRTRLLPCPSQALLTASLKLFFRRAPECRAALGAALAAGVADADQEVHDRALLYHRLLQQGVGAAQNVVDVARPALTAFADAQSAETQARGRLGAWLRGVWAAARPHRPARGTTRPLGNQRRATRATSFR